MKISRLLAVLLVSLSLSSCQYYGVNFSQGNELSQEQMNKLRPGLSENQVLDIMGTPLYDNTFSNDRWIYVYTKQKRKEMLKKKVILDFKNGRLKKITY